MSFLVALDAGHGKETPGKRSPDSSLMEWEFNRSMAARVKRYLEAAGVKVILTADTTEDITLAKRCAIANKAKANVFVSLHANASGSGTWDSVRGWEAYVCAKGGKAEKLAQAIHKTTIASGGLKDRGIKTANFYVLRKTNMPAVLIEHCFYTNREEVELLKSDNFRDKLAMADAQGILNYLGVLGGDKVTTQTYGRNSAYSLENGMHIMKIPPKDFRVQHWNRAKKTTEIRNYANGGFFAKDAGAKTLPVGNLKADVYPEKLVNDEKYYYITTHEHGYIEDGKMIVETKNTKQKQMTGKKVSTLYLYNNGVPQIEATDFVPDDCKYAISGAPVMLKGKDCSWKNDVLAQGFDGSIAYATWHGFLGLKGDGYIYYIGMKTSSGNLWTESEAYNKLKSLGFRDVIKIDGGGSYIMDVDGSNKAVTSENRVINNVVRFL